MGEECLSAEPSRDLSAGGAGVQSLSEESSQQPESLPVVLVFVKGLAPSLPRDWSDTFGEDPSSMDRSSQTRQVQRRLLR